MPKLKIALMQSNDNRPHRRVATTSSTSLPSNTPLPSVMNQSYLLELDDVTLQKATWSKSRVQGAIPVIPFWIGLLVMHGLRLSEAGPTISNSPGKPREAQNTWQKTPPPSQSILSSTHLHPQRLSWALSKGLLPEQGERERKKNPKVLCISSELASQNHTRSYSNRPTLNKRWQDLQEDLHKKQWTWTKRLCNANPVETAEKLDGQDFWTKKTCLILSENLKIKTKTVPTNPTCFDRRKGQQQN